MIKNIIYVEDGSIDVDELQKQLTKDTKIISYRQGSNPPCIKALEIPIEYAREERQKIRRVEAKNKELCKTIEKLNDLKRDYYYALQAAKNHICEKCGCYENEECKNCRNRNDGYLIECGKEEGI